MFDFSGGIYPPIHLDKATEILSINCYCCVSLCTHNPFDILPHIAGIPAMLIIGIVWHLSFHSICSGTGGVLYRRRVLEQWLIVLGDF